MGARCIVGVSATPTVRCCPTVASHAVHTRAVDEFPLDMSLTEVLGRRAAQVVPLVQEPGAAAGRHLKEEVERLGIAADRLPGHLVQRAACDAWTGLLLSSGRLVDRPGGARLHTLSAEAG